MQGLPLVIFSIFPFLNAFLNMQVFAFLNMQGLHLFQYLPLCDFSQYQIFKYARPITPCDFLSFSIFKYVRLTPRVFSIFPFLNMQGLPLVIFLNNSVFKYARLTPCDFPQYFHFKYTRLTPCDFSRYFHF